MNANRNYKDSVFTALFNEPDLLRELYCALGNVSLPKDVPVSINTLKNVLYMDRYNDISFEIGGKLVVLIEHQSTINPNLALRFLFYISRVLEKIIKRKTLYSGKKVTIPRPEFYVLYNGPKSFPDNAVFKLSDLFRETDGLDIPEDTLPMLELEAKVININDGRNTEILNRCQKLSEYSKLIAKIYTYKEEFEDLEEAIENAIKYCEKNGILKEFLKIHGSEVLNMLLEEWNMDDALAVAREEGREEGHENGCRERDNSIARKALAKGSTPEFVHEITGLSLEEIAKL